MSKRRINKQQNARIEKIQKNYQHNKDLDLDLLADGLVITRFGKHVELENEQGKKVLCAIRPNLDSLVAGDRVVWQAEGLNQGVVVSIYPRASILARPTNNGLQKPVAANITQLIIVIAPKPEVSWSLLDSYLVMAETLKLHAVVLLNKTDIPSTSIQNQLLNDYKPLDYPLIFASTHKPDTLFELNKALNHQVSVFVGQSGVGKSSLISSLLPHEKQITTGELSTNSQLGQHTTSNSRYYHLPQGGALIDSPGVREFCLWNMDPTTIAQGYKEFRPYLNQCKFRNCTHLNTPQCALSTALNNGVISRSRYENYIQLCSMYKQTHY